MSLQFEYFQISPHCLFYDIVLSMFLISTFNITQFYSDGEALCRLQDQNPFIANRDAKFLLAAISIRSKRLFFPWCWYLVTSSLIFSSFRFLFSFCLYRYYIFIISYYLLIVFFTCWSLAVCSIKENNLK